MAKPIVVTGAAGFIGRNVVAELNARGERELILVDELGKDEKWKNLVGLQYEDIVSPEEFLGMIEDGAFADARVVDPPGGLQRDDREGCRLSAAEQLPVHAGAL